MSIFPPTGPAAAESSSHCGLFFIFFSPHSVPVWTISHWCAPASLPFPWSIVALTVEIVRKTERPIHRPHPRIINSTSRFCTPFVPSGVSQFCPISRPIPSFWSLKSTMRSGAFLPHSVLSFYGSSSAAFLPQSQNQSRELRGPDCRARPTRGVNARVAASKISRFVYGQHAMAPVHFTPWGLSIHHVLSPYLTVCALSESRALSNRCEMRYRKCAGFCCRRGVRPLIWRERCWAEG